jgi:DNA-binding winged helix-turn-helix (wHTH) protein
LRTRLNILPDRSAAVSGEVFEFGPFLLDPEDLLLFGPEGRVPLPPKVFEALVVLVRSGGRLVRREQLARSLWPDVFVSDAALSQKIWLLRDALRRGGAEGEFLETVPKAGYRFRPTVRARIRA